MKALAARKWKAYSELIQLTTWCQSSWRHTINIYQLSTVFGRSYISCSWWIELSTTSWVLPFSLPFAACASRYSTNLRWPWACDGLWTLPGSGMGFVWAMWVIWFGAWRDGVNARISVPSLCETKDTIRQIDKQIYETCFQKRPFMEKVEVHPEPEPHSQLWVRFASVGWLPSLCDRWSWGIFSGTALGSPVLLANMIGQASSTSLPFLCRIDERVSKPKEVCRGRTTFTFTLVLSGLESRESATSSEGWIHGFIEKAWEWWG